MSALLRDSALGQTLRFLTKNKILLYPEEVPGWECPSHYSGVEGEKGIATPQTEGPSPAAELEKLALHRPESIEHPPPAAEGKELDDEQLRTVPTVASAGAAGLGRVDTAVTMSKIESRRDLEQAYRTATLEKGPTMPIIPETLEDGTILVDWYDTDDPENPQNWSLGKKNFVAFQICFYTLAVYMGSAIYAPSQPGVMEEFGVGLTASSLGLALYVLAYGIGPMLWAPLSEIPSIGRTPPYIGTFALFVILTVPTALVKNFAGLLVLRFLQGFFGSPCLATGGATMGDIFSLIKLPYALSLWALFATAGPALGPIVSGFSVPVKGWRWSMWELLWFAGPALILLFCCLPETSSSNILLRRAARLRKISGDNRLKSQSEIDQANMSSRDTAIFYLWKPWQITALDPAVLFTSVYTSLVYGIFYSFFEVFPLVYPVMYGFNAGESGLAFLSIPVAGALSVGLYWAYLWYVVEPDLMKNGLPAPERRLIPALFSAFLVPIGLFMFGWLSNPKIHFIASIISVGIFTVGVFIILQCIFLYVPLTYPPYAASLFAANDFCRSSIAFAAILFAHPMFDSLGVGKGVSLLASLTCACVGGIWLLYYYGADLRARSRFAVK
ncbi:MAG: hypothetical protein M1832_006106 [Thelocarpon impressellum]|nr:MAG: hypothetical protein M1832_006106 [Thelocarpon impressellum]